jgi:hypothetical protein
MKPETFLAINAAGYIILGLLCAFAPHYTAELVGFALPNAKGLVEYIAVYGGLEFGMGIFFAFTFFFKNLGNAGVLFSLCLYSAIVAFRTLGMIVNAPTQDFGWLLYSLEVCCFIISLALWRRAKSALEGL